MSLASNQSKTKLHRLHSQNQQWRSNHKEDGQQVRTDSPVHPQNNSTSMHIYVQDEVHQSYSMDDIQPLRPTVLPERKSNLMLNAVEHV